MKVCSTFVRLYFVPNFFYCLLFTCCLVLVASTYQQTIIKRLLYSSRFCFWFVLLLGVCLLIGMHYINFFNYSTIFYNIVAPRRGKLQPPVISILFFLDLRFKVFVLVNVHELQSPLGFVPSLFCYLVLACWLVLIALTSLTIQQSSIALQHLIGVSFNLHWFLFFCFWI